MKRRTFKAYQISFIIISRYLMLYLGKKVLGQKYWDKRIQKLHGRSAIKIKKGLLELNGLFIKVGQMISILSNILPYEFRAPLESLQDQMPPRPFDEIKATIENEFGQNINKIFRSFDTTPLAAASIGQTHRAVLKNGTDVVVKVQHKDIEKMADVDMAVVKNLVKIAEFFFKMKGMDYTYSQLKIMINEELDYLHEAEAMIKVKRLIEDRSPWVVPSIHKDYSTKKVITSTYYEGVKISDIKQLDAWNIDRKALSDTFLRDFCQMIFEDEIFHADPHPGNILVNKEGQIILLDFGAVTQLDTGIKEAIPGLIIAFTKNDTKGIVKALKKMGFVGSGQETSALAEKLIEIGQQFLKEEVQIENFNLDGISINQDTKIIQKLFDKINLKEIGQTFQIPKDWILLQRVIVLVLGVSNQLYPSQNPIKVLEPYFKKMAMGSTKNMARLVLDAVKSQIMTLISLPHEIEKVLKLAQNDGIAFEDKKLHKINKRLVNIGQQLIFVLIFMASIHFVIQFEIRQLNQYISLTKWIAGLSFLGFIYYFFKRK